MVLDSVDRGIVTVTLLPQEAEQLAHLLQQARAETDEQCAWRLSTAGLLTASAQLSRLRAGEEVAA